ncbi:unnamed protein product [Euphydryas editha]|uniref:Uncharacterized protein n=1 Tax=Euphydryas editha TaxID=104508 RepID=A0AAU9ULF9_EUPED|nr:unnamed protein product [Euphydryas editha]
MPKLKKLKHHPQLTLRQSTGTSLARTIRFNKFQVDQFYKNMKKLYEKLKYQSSRMYKVHEAGVGTVPKKTPSYHNKFVNWFHRFKYFVHPSLADPVLILLDIIIRLISLEALKYTHQPVAELPSTEENQTLGDRTSSNMEVTGPSQLESPSRSQTRGTVDVTPDLVRPYPKAGPRKLHGMKRKRKRTRILTDTPEKRHRNGRRRKTKKNKIKELNKNRKCSKDIGQKTIPKLAEEFTSKPTKNRKISSDDEIENVSV